MKLVYLSAPYTTGPDFPEQRQRDIDRAAAWLMEHSGVYVFSPITYEKPLKKVYGENKDWDFWKPLDAEMVHRCDELWVLCLHNWEASRGVKFEIRIAQAEGKPIQFVYPEMNWVECKDCNGACSIGPPNSVRECPCFWCVHGQIQVLSYRVEPMKVAV